MNLLIIHAAGVSLALIGCMMPLFVYRLWKVRSQRNYQADLVEFEKLRAEQLLEEIHRLEKESTQDLVFHKQYVAELCVERDVALDRAKKAEEATESAWAQVSTEVEIRVGFQNRAARAEEERETLRSQLATCYEELKESEIRSRQKNEDLVRAAAEREEFKALASRLTRESSDWKRKAMLFDEMSSAGVSMQRMEAAKDIITGLRMALLRLEQNAPKRGTSGRFVKQS